jgi:hypothetical protein
MNAMLMRRAGYPSAIVFKSWGVIGEQSAPRTWGSQVRVAITEIL